MVINDLVLYAQKDEFDKTYLSLNKKIRAHSVHVGLVTATLANSFKKELSEIYSLSSDAVYMAICNGGCYHDIGLCFLQDKIYDKNSPQDTDEAETIFCHPEQTGNILNRYACVLFEEEGEKQIALDMGLYHHERHDGSGYPFGISGDDIPLLAQLCALIDVLDKAIDLRRSGNAFDRAVDKIREYKGRWFSPVAIECFERNYNEIRDLYLGKHKIVPAMHK